MNITHSGILWIILYPKWPAIAIYFFHVSMMSSILVLALIELDRQPIKPLFAITITAVFIGAALLYWPIHPVSVGEHLPISLEVAPWIGQLLKPVVGGAVGLAIGASLSLFGIQTSSLRLALLLTGVALGWQALLQSTVLFLLAMAATRFFPRIKPQLMQHPTSVLLAGILLHHPFWKTISNWWN